MFHWRSACNREMRVGLGKPALMACKDKLSRVIGTAANRRFGWPAKGQIRRAGC